MTARVLTDFFTHQYNQREVIKQDYEAAKEHFREVCLHRIAGNVDHDQRFRDALDRQSAAREHYVAVLTGDKV